MKDMEDICSLTLLLTPLPFHLAGNANMQSAGILLGVLPTILTFIGTSKVETGILALRRPLLAFLISAGAPAVNPLRTFEYTSPGNILQSWEGRKVHPVPARRWCRSVLVLLQYFVVLAALANVMEVTRELAYWAICSWAPEDVFLPFFWSCGTLLLHVLGVLAVHQRVRLTSRGSQAHKNSFYNIPLARCRAWLAQEFTLSSPYDHGREELSLKPETYWFLFTNWCLSAIAMCHIILGTLVLSSMLFISTADAAVVAFRFMASTMACRLVLTHELCGLQQVVDVRQGPVMPCSSSTEFLQFKSNSEARVDIPLVRAHPLHTFEPSR
jgi:hypothetical protein